MRFARWGMLVLGVVLPAGFAAVAQAHAPRADPNAHLARIHRARDVRTVNLPYGGGPVLHRNRTHVIFWQPDGSGLSFDPGYQPLIEAFLSNVAAASRNGSNVYGLSGQYRDATGPATYQSVYGGSVLATDPLPPNGCVEPPATGPAWGYCLTDQQLQREIEHVVRADRLPTGPSDVYFLLTPNGLGDCSDSASTACALGGDANGYCAYHSQTNDGLVLYAVIPYNAVPGHCASGNPRPNGNTADPALSTISHEQSEMITDPSGNAWVDPQNDNEVGDLCLTNFGPDLGGTGPGAWNEVINGGHYYLQEEWSNADHACEPRARSDSLGFDARPTPGQGPGLRLGARATAAHGAIVSYEWFFGDRRSSHGRQATHHYWRPGAYRVVLRTTDSWGNWAFYARTVVVTAGRAPRATSATKRG